MRCLLTLVLCAALPAQAVVIHPKHFNFGNEATSTAFLGFPANGGRWLQIHNIAYASTTTNALVIGAISFRARTGGGGGVRVTMSMDMSTSTNPGPRSGTYPDAVFDANHSPDRAQVVAPRVIDFTPPSPLRGGSMNWRYRIPLDRPYAPTPRSSLVWDVSVTSIAGGPAPGLEYHSHGGPGGGATSHWSMPAGCPGPSLAGQWSFLYWGVRATMDLRMTGGPPSAPAVLAMHARQNNRGLPPALNLPGTGCTLHFPPTALLFTQTDPSGVLPASFTVVPPPFTWRAHTFYAQAVTLDPARPGGLAVSNARAMRINWPYEAVYGVSSLVAAGSQGPTGTISGTDGLAIRLN